MIILNISVIGKLVLYSLLAIIACIISVYMVVKQAAAMKSDRSVPDKYYPGPFDPDGVRFNVSEQFLYYMMVAFAVIGIIAILIMIVELWSISQGMGVVQIVLGIFLLVTIAFLANSFYFQLQNGKSYIVIDEQGIHGLQAVYFDLFAKPKFEEINFAWKQVEYARYVGQQTESNSREHLDFYDATNPDAPFTTIYSNLLPISKVIDCINYFYARYSHKSVSDNPLIAPL